MTRLVRFANNATSKLASNLSAVGLTMSVTPGDGAKFPALTAGQFFKATLVKSDGTKEVVKVTARSTDTMTIVRANEAVGGVQTAYAFTAGDKVELRLTATALSDELDRLDAAAFLDVVSKSANYTITEADISKLIKTDTTAGNVTITLPQISTLTGSFEVQIYKNTGDGNVVTIARTGADTINGATSYVLASQYQCVWLVADLATNTWTAITSANASNKIADQFIGAGTAGPFTLSGDPGSKNNTDVYVGGVYQNKSTYTVTGTQLTLGGVVAAGVIVECNWAQPLPVGTPSDLTVTPAKLADSVKAAIQSQTWTGFTSAGTAPAFTLTPSPAILAYAAGQRFRVAAHAAGTTGSNTLNVSGLGVKNLRQYDSTGAKVPAIIASGQLIDVEYDGTDFVVLDPLPPTIVNTVPVRQTVLSGPVDTNGFSNFGGSTGGATVTIAGTLVATAANGFGASGQVDRVGSITNPSWTGLNVGGDGTKGLFIEIAANGTCTTGFSNSLPTYRWGGADVVTNGQHTFNIQEMQMKVGNGTTAAQTFRVFVGEVTVAGGVVTAITWYALMGRYQRTQTMPAANTPLSFSHNLGVKPDLWKMVWVCGTAQAGLAVGDELDIVSVMYNTSPNNQASTMLVARMTATYLLSSTAVAIYRADTGGFLTITPSQFTVKLVAQRGW